MFLKVTLLMFEFVSYLLCAIVVDDLIRKLMRKEFYSLEYADNLTMVVGLLL